ncbi:MMPL family transporter [Gilvimarinus agarilyticus]|uniref:MMPL family transporter n=1 Tax=Gilvimarinus agarilyticus TaxID=679259 RepID=UPI0005A1EF21|nr:MMPL family transporter [Gilvimarinus agarilyticus]
MNSVLIARRLSGLWLLLMLLLAVWQLPQLSLDSNILALFPDGDSRSAEARVEQAFSSRFERRVVLLFGADEPDTARQQLPQVRAALSACECFQLTEAASAPASLASVYQGHTAQLLTPQWRQRLQQGNAEQLVAQALRRLFTRPGGVGAEALINDPLGSLADFTRTSQPQSKVQIDSSGNPYVVLKRRRYFVVPLELTGSPFNVTVQNTARAAIAAADNLWRELPGAEVLKTGALFYTLAGTDQARREISTVGVGSLLGIIALLLLVFRSPALLLLAFVPLAAGVVAGLATSALVFGAVHVMALVFGAALVGVAIDYGLHYFSARLASGMQWSATRGTRHLLAPLALGLGTSVVGYLSFIAAGFPGFTQIAVLSSTGLVTALATVLFCYPSLLARPPRREMPAGLQYFVRHLARAHERVLQPLAPRRLWLWGVLLGLIALLSLAPTSDSIRQMQQPDPALVQMETRVREGLGAGTALQYVLLQAPSADALMQRLAQTVARLEPLKGSQALAGYDALTRVLPSAQQQQHNQTLWQSAVIDSGALPQLAQKLQLTDSAYQKMLQAVSPRPPLTLENIEQALLERPDLPLYFTDEGEHFSAVSLATPIDVATVRQALAGLDGVSLVDPVARTDQLLAHYRHSAAGLLLLAYVIIGVLLARRYTMRGALGVILPPALASTLALAIISVLGYALNVFHLMALLLVLGIGIDYTLFLREAHSEQVGTRLAIGLSTLTTVLSFGLLALSATAAIHSFGLTVLLGIVMAYLLAPLVNLAETKQQV